METHGFKALQPSASIALQQKEKILHILFSAGSPSVLVSLDVVPSEDLSKLNRVLICKPRPRNITKNFWHSYFEYFMCLLAIFGLMLTPF